MTLKHERALTVAWLFEKLGDVLWSRVLLALKGQTFDVQERAISDLIEGNTSQHRPLVPSALGVAPASGRPATRDAGTAALPNEEGNRPDRIGARGGGAVIRRGFQPRLMPAFDPGSPTPDNPAPRLTFNRP